MIFWVIVAWIVLSAKPSRSNLFLLAGVIAAISLIGLTLTVGASDAPVSASILLPYLIGLAIWLVAFLAIGFVIIWIRGGSVEGDAAKAKKLDKEMECIRAEIAARENQQQAPPQ